ncbi:hypothetical protein EGI11_10860 [Chryseobacterium sp. H3056]|uniref:Uncharacterized protein n=1 Tax=Kaistella daneshvariae TaxID=2487074 RepID=A0A3N0WVI6_9FLAO|nr:hypothetical protein EGI11_10860 [Kaistella daneshvariae]
MQIIFFYKFRNRLTHNFFVLAKIIIKKNSFRSKTVFAPFEDYNPLSVLSPASVATSPGDATAIGARGALVSSFQGKKQKKSALSSQFFTSAKIRKIHAN